MADTSSVFQPIFAAGSQPNAPLSLACPLGPSIVRRILLTFPAGCGGLVGVQVHAGNGFAFPNRVTQFLSFDDFTYDFEVRNQIDTGQWSLVGYNIDQIDHEVSIVFEFDYLRGINTPQAQTAVAL